MATQVERTSLANAYTVTPPVMRKRARYGLADWVRFLILAVGAISMILPLLWMLSIALKNNSEVFTLPPDWIPHQFEWSNFVKGTVQIDFWRVFMNSVIVSVLSTVGSVISSTLVGYGLSRIRFTGRKVWFYLFVCSMMLPQMVTIIPVFHLFSMLGWYNTWLPLIVPSFFGNPFFIFLARQYFSNISKSFDEAAKIDGANHLQILVRIIAPMSKPMLVTILIMAFQASWNDFLNPLLYLMNPKLWTLSVATASYIGQFGTSWNLFMAADLIYMLPMLLIFFAAQKYFMQGLGALNASGLK